MKKEREQSHSEIARANRAEWLSWDLANEMSCAVNEFLKRVVMYI